LPIMRRVIGDWPDEGKTTAAFITGLEPKHSRRPHRAGSRRKINNERRRLAVLWKGSGIESW
jgi:hypothetical protein